MFTTFAGIDNKKLFRLPVYFPGLETQRRIGNIWHTLAGEIENCTILELREKLKELRDELLDQLICRPILRQYRIGEKGV